ncbi:Stk1 family PASTA domain-containing Ser/Thr kinase [Allostreptomyces psammosilenae]|uniref:non-specific serine/threonine protein kinase n=1 Tax=Allostreptomyces psammosilenae TaxID=1892865 RepID=A0A853A4F2_9ACTN|nr:Stk1 family PASTA domain-containing Ser/Thr kinase [Allostreptomyces psammosilenae]NYI05378.1 serine/threonine-protein kinase [Allostreptomyces psammosilenae]
MEEPRRLGGRYELGSVLGRGGMAEVYLGHDIRLGRTVAVKTLRADLARDPSFQARFRREAQSAASLNHPAIVAVYDTGEDYVDGVSIPYIVMEYVDGSTLRELLHSGRRLLPERALEMTAGVLQALEYSHRSGIVHRDIKPANVMLTRNGTVKVMDFGIARAMGDQGMTMTQTAAVIGTAQYLSPEQAKGETVDARSDLYSTGCLLYELLAMRPPFIGDSPVAVAYQHVREEPQPPSAFDPEITPEMDAIVLKALAKDRDYRYQSADEMRADIERALDGLPVEAAAAMVGGGYDEYGNYYDQPQAAAATAVAPAAHHAAPAASPGGPGTAVMPPIEDAGDGYGGRRADRRSSGGGRNGNTSVILLVIAAVVVLGGAFFIGQNIFSGGGDDEERTVAVPNLVGQTFEEAQQSAQSVQLTVTNGGEEACEDQDPGRICSQTPTADSQLALNGAITVMISTGPAEVQIPESIVGKSVEDAEAELEELGFDVERETTINDSAEPGTVLSADPPAGSSLAPGETVTLQVADQSPTVAVPNVVGMTSAEASAAITEAGLQVQFGTAEVTPGQGNDVVIRQDIPPNSQVARDQMVTLVATPIDNEAQVQQQQQQQPSQSPTPPDPGQENAGQDGGGQDGGIDWGDFPWPDGGTENGGNGNGNGGGEGGD